METGTNAETRKSYTEANRVEHEIRYIHKTNTSDTERNRVEIKNKVQSQNKGMIQKRIGLEQPYAWTGAEVKLGTSVEQEHGSSNGGTTIEIVVFPTPQEYQSVIV